jgi:hypothetical protein
MTPPRGGKGAPQVTNLGQGLLQLYRECIHCRECRELVSPFERVCPRCGASGPVVVSIKPFLLPVGVCAAAVIALLLFL